jgi:hypothetical protein
VFLFALTLLLTITLVQPVQCWGFYQSNGMSDEMAQTIRENNKLRKTIAAIILWSKDNGYLTVDPPNVFGSIVKVGIPEPTGAIQMKALPRQDCTYFFAREIHKRMETLTGKASFLPRKFSDNESLNSCFSQIRNDISYLILRDQYIQNLANLSSNNPKLVKLIEIRELIAMDERAADLNFSLKRARREINKDGAALKAANKGINWR